MVLKKKKKKKKKKKTKAKALLKRRRFQRFCPVANLVLIFFIFQLFIFILLPSIIIHTYKVLLIIKF